MLRPVPSVGRAGAPERNCLTDGSAVVAIWVVRLSGAAGPVPPCAFVLRHLHSPSYLRPASRAMLTAPAVGSLAASRTEHRGRYEDRSKDHGDDHRHTHPDWDRSAQPKSATLRFPLTLR